MAHSQVDGCERCHHGRHQHRIIASTQGSVRGRAWLCLRLGALQLSTDKFLNVITSIASVQRPLELPLSYSNTITYISFTRDTLHQSAL